uniref:Putative Ankyrin repeat-containing protein n=1 Tax=Davidia involucrata TaxID=16924 RepID=A0A5B6YKP1_DAVIN
MEKRLFEAARTGNIGSLQQLLEENPLILADFALISPHENPLHIATKAGQLVFVQEIIRHKPELARELNQDGFRPMDIASSLGYVEIVKEILTSTGPDHEICRMVGRHGRTALHYAAIQGRVEIIDELLSSCAESIKDVTVLGETALHLAVKHYKIEAFRKLVGWLQLLGLEELLNYGDNDGNTVLHLAVSRKQLESVELLVGGSNSMELNGLNSRGLTAMDIAEIVIESPIDVQLKEILRCAGGLGAQNITSSVSQLAPVPPLERVATIHQNRQEEDWFKYFRFQMQRDSPSDTRNALLVVAALIATVTFQAGVNPPNAFLQESNQKNSTTTSDTTVTPPPPPLLIPPQRRMPTATTTFLAALFANSASLAPSNLFLLGNTMGLTASLSIIIYLTSGFPFQRELQLSIYSMMFAYGCSVDAIKPDGALKHVFLGIAFFLPFMLRWPPMWGKRLWRWWKKQRGEPHMNRRRQL